MKKLVILAFCLLACQPEQAPAIKETCPPPTTCKPPNIQVLFSPKGVVTLNIVNNLRRAQHWIRVQAYSFTSEPIAEALIAAHKRGVTVSVIVDKGQLTAKGSVINSLVDMGIPVYIDDAHAIAHNKIILVDDDTVLTGSFNFTNAAEHNNAENAIWIVDKMVADAYFHNWYEHRQHSKIYNP